MEVQQSLLLPTELSNPLTSSIEVASDVGIIRLLRQCDAQLFTGFHCFESINDQSFLIKLDSLVKHLATFFDPNSNNKKTKVIISGAGTSGRLAFLSARSFNKIAQIYKVPVTFEYLIAGGDRALIKGIEKAEDDVQLAKEDLKNLYGDTFDHFIYIGITCGLAAPYIGGQLEYILENEEVENKTTAILMGFNPTESARNVAIEGWNKTILQIVKTVSCRAQTKNYFILNPICGPEPITGSTRMKSGSLSKILVDSLFGMLFLPFAQRHLKQSSQETTFYDVFATYEQVNRYTYKNEENLATLIHLAHSSLAAGRSIYYFGEDNQGVLGLIDASECPPTFGSKLSDVRGLIVGGWKAMGNREGDLTNHEEAFRIDGTSFPSDRLHEDDLVVVLHSSHQDVKEKEAFLLKLNQLKIRPKIATIEWTIKTLSPTPSLLRLSGTYYFSIDLPCFELFPYHPTFRDMATKWILNVISTGAHIKLGKVFGNIMIDVQVSNNKLYYRGLGMLKKLCHISDDHKAEEILLKSIYLVDKVSPELLQQPISSHITAASRRTKVIPLAVLLGFNKFQSVNEALEALSTTTGDPRVSNIINSFRAKV